MRRNKADELYSIVMKRYKEEYPNTKLTNEEMESIWYTIYGIICRDGEEKALKYINTAKLL